MEFDAVIIGGSFAGISAAMQIARGRRSVCVIDAGQPRNRFAKHSHGFFGRDGVPPLEMLKEGREKLLAYPNVTFQTGEVATVASDGNGGFEVALKSGEKIRGR